ncbi:MAG: M28 family metallopeptidase [Armatimonadota bacterium]|nr:M28 family metallopeptidase [Armatimonadota bacterium]MDR7425078.1 M28 family metallopeptidase [Armatimonadota bacterium]
MTVRGRCGFVAVALLAVWAAAAPGAPVEDAGARAWSHVAALAALGPRVAGSAAERRAAEYVAAQLRSAGYHVQITGFPFPYFETRQVALEVTSPVRVRLSPRALAYSTGGQVVAPLVVAGRGLAEDFQEVDARGKVALVERGGITFLQKAENAARAGARAVVVYNHEPGPVVGTLTRPAGIPAVTVSREEGLRLRELVGRGPVVVSLVVDTLLETRASWNVVGELPGRSAARVLLGAHVDSVEGSPGANDNASGVAAALEAARALRSRPPAWTVEVAAFGAEEGGLFGSSAYARSPRARGLAAMLNLDMVGAGGRLLVGNTGADRRVVDAVLHSARELDISVEEQRMGSSDHVAFERAGIPAAMLHRPGDPHYHSPEDTPDRVRPELLDPVVRLAAESLRRPALVTAGVPRPAASRPRGRL